MIGRRRGQTGFWLTQISEYIFTTFLDRQPEMDYPGQEEAPEAPQGSLRKSLVPLAPPAPDPLTATRVMGRVATHKAGSRPTNCIIIKKARGSIVNCRFTDGHYFKALNIGLL